MSIEKSTYEFWRQVPKPEMPQEEIEKKMKVLWEECMRNAKSPEFMYMSRQLHRIVCKDLYPDYWPSWEKIREIERRLAP